MSMDTCAQFLPQEILTNILTRLPVKILIRFQCVCKEWKIFIKSPSFIADHLQRLSTQKPLLLLHRRYGSEGPHLQMLDYKSRILEVLASPINLLGARIVGSSNGLLCLKIYNESPSLPSLLLWNPATREVRELPQPINNISGDFGAGFGFTARVNDYKIVKYGANQFFDNKDNRVEVFSLSTGSWKEIQIGNFGVVHLHHHLPVTVGGAMFWFGCKPSEGELCWMIMSFDLVMDMFSLISLPTLLDFGPYDRLTVYENKLAILSLFVIGDRESSVIDLWVMDESAGASEERGGWSKIYSISTCPVMFPCCIWLEEIVCDAYLSTGYDLVRLLNLNTLELENVGSSGHGCFLAVTPNYVESLVPVGNNHIEER